MSVRLYGLANCDTCRKARNWLTRFSIEHEFIDCRRSRIDPAVLAVWAERLGGWEALINRASTTWRNLPPARKQPGSVPEWTLLLKEYPQLMRRPVVIAGEDGFSQGFSDNGFKKIFGVGA